MKQHILVMDDDEAILDAFILALTDAGFKVETCSNEDALFTLINKDKIPDLIILDYLLSGINGITVCKKLKNNKKTKNIPIIMISAHPDARSVSLNARADDFLEKPFEIEELQNRIKKLIDT